MVIFPENATKEEKEYIKKIYLENAKKLLNNLEYQAKDWDDTIKMYQKLNRMNKDRIKELKSGIKNADDMVI
jgi:hypothetical protein